MCVLWKHWLLAAVAEDIPLLKDLPFSLRVKLHQESPGLAVWVKGP